MTLPSTPHFRTRSKMRGIPKQPSEAGTYAELQQLSIEKQRLRQELEGLEAREQQIRIRLQAIDQTMLDLKATAEQYETPPDPNGTLSVKQPVTSPFSPMTFEY